MFNPEQRKEKSESASDSQTLPRGKLHHLLKGGVVGCPRATGFVKHDWFGKQESQFVSMQVPGTDCVRVAPRYRHFTICC